MKQSLSNLPVEKPQYESTIQAFDAYYSRPLELDANVYAAMKGYFTNRGFEDVAAESITIIIMKQAKADNYKPMQILDTLKGLNDSELSALVAEILNYNRLKTSSLGVAQPFTPNFEVSRNILA